MKNIKTNKVKMPQASVSYCAVPADTVDDAAGAACGGDGDARDARGVRDLITKGEVISCSSICCRMSRCAITSVWFATCIPQTSAIYDYITPQCTLEPLKMITGSRRKEDTHWRWLLCYGRCAGLHMLLLRLGSKR